MPASQQPRYVLWQNFPGTNSAKFFVTDAMAPPGLSVLSVRAVYTSSPVGPPKKGADRVIDIGVYDAHDVVQWVSGAPAPQLPSTVQTYYCASGLTVNLLADGNSYMPWPVDYTIPPGGYVRVWDDNNIDPTGDGINIYMTIH